ncbi:MAG: hypothetical protein FWG96_02590 [Methanomassiliicoccaceae archaeon]|nr:hypothetical protein [Methanomassiliicoccaceae archaeon]
MNQAVKLPIEDLNREPYVSLLCYPYADPQEADRRIAELRGIGVTAVEFKGNVLAAGLPVVGKGHEGVVVTAYADGERLALKVRRADSIRRDPFHEAEMLRKANGIGVGPRFKAVTGNFLLSQLIDGGRLAEWMECNMEKAAFRRVLEDLLEQCWRLDEAGLDHGELSNAPRHILADGSGKPFIVDFETASVRRRTSNVTSVCQYLFLGNSDARMLISEVLGREDNGRIREILTDYKKERSRDRFEALLGTFL